MKFFLILSIFFMISCASTNNSVVKNNRLVLLTDKLKPLKQLENLERVTSTRGEINILAVIDNRAIKTSIGEATVGATNTAIPIDLDIPTEAYVKNKFTSGLSKRGVMVVPNSRYGVNYKINKLRVWEQVNNGRGPEYANCEVEMSFSVIPSTGNTAVYNGSVSASASGTDSVFDATDSNGPVLESCMDMLAEKFVSDEKLNLFLGIKSLK